MDSHTNNASLVLAFALVRKAEQLVMLFPGDAQIRNWLSWQDCAWPVGARPADAITAKMLLQSAVLYKVGHHCSHNATLREGRLELMIHPELVAMIPVNERFARDTKRWNIPFPALLDRLLSRTSGRLIRADKGKDALEQSFIEVAGKIDEGRVEWECFLNRVSEGRNSHRP